MNPSAPLMTNVGITQTYQPPNRSARDEPIPPAMAPTVGPKVSALIMTTASPMLKTPSVAGIGNWISIVVTQTKAVITAEIAIKAEELRVFPLNMFLMISPPSNITFC